MINSAAVPALEEQDVSGLAVWGYAFLDGVVHAVLFGDPIKVPDFLPVHQLGLLHALILLDELLHRLLALGLYIVMRLRFGLRIPKQLPKRTGQRASGQFAGIDDQSDRFVFDILLHGGSPPLSEMKRSCQGGTSSR